MGSSSFLFLLFTLLSLVSHASPSFFTSRSLCHNDESSALAKFKESLNITTCDPSDPFAYPKLESWKRSDCCSWDGVECDNITGHVIGLDLSSSCLYGSLSSNSSLFQLVHLDYLNLATNNFDLSPIPSMLGYLPQLTYLNLSFSSLAGQIPMSISQLAKLSTLDLYGNNGLVLMKNLDLGSFTQNFSSLEYLHLGLVDISSPVPESLANLSSLTSLLLRGCELYAEFPEAIFQLPNLKHLSLSSNWNLKGHFPEFNSSSPLQRLILSHTSFSGLLPASIGKLTSLNIFDIDNCSFYGQVPTSFGNLTQLSVLDLTLNKFGRHNFTTFSWLGKQVKLTFLRLNFISFNAEIPAYLANLTHLETLGLAHCHLLGPIPFWLSKLNQLDLLTLSHNQLQGAIPSSISHLTKLSTLNLAGNNLGGNIPTSIFQLQNLLVLDLSFSNLSGMIEFDNFLKLKNLIYLELSGNKLSLLQKANYPIIRKFSFLGLGSCNLQQFPFFLHNQNELSLLDLSNNNIHGKIPKWVWNTMQESLEYIDLSYNSLTGFESNPAFLPWSRAIFVDFEVNMFQGSLHMPPPSIEFYIMSANQFTGQIPLSFCELSSLRVLSLAQNNLGGELPQCLGNLSTSLEVLELYGNNFHGKIPQMHTKECNLRMLALEYNKLDGQVPKSLINCSRLEFINLGGNQINDTFPFWLGVLQDLKVLVLKSNHFHGGLESRDQTNFGFPNLRIIDLAWNNFSGPLPAQYFLRWKAMKIAEHNGLTYLEAVDLWLFSYNFYAFLTIYYPLTLTNKGIQITYDKVLEYLAAIDLSGNRFEGTIPECVGGLQGLRLLNLSNNLLTGFIPQSLSNLSVLEALDLSRNNLLGKIPQELAGLTFLSFFNVSYNQLTGPIPHGNQFNTFQNDSYMGNSGLCGSSLSNKCGDASTTPASSSEEDDDSIFEFGWEPVAIGYGCGFVLGIGIGLFIYTKKHEWIVKVFGFKRRMRRVVMGVHRWN